MNEEEAKTVEEVINQVDSILNHIKSRLEKRRNLDKQNEIQMAITDASVNLLESSRMFCFEDQAIYFSGSLSLSLKKGEKCYLFLYNDLLVVCKVLEVAENEKNLEVKGMLELKESTCSLENDYISFKSKKGKTVKFIREQDYTEELKERFDNRETKFY